MVDCRSPCHDSGAIAIGFYNNDLAAVFNVKHKIVRSRPNRFAAYFPVTVISAVADLFLSAVLVATR
jgi:hypothetical protein